MDPTLKLEAAWDIEEGYDFGYVEISADDGKTYTAIAGDRTVAGPLGPGLTGTSGAVLPLSYNLSAYAGKKVLLALRYVSDSAVNRGGWRIGKVTLGSQNVSDGSTLDGWKSPSALVPTPVDAWHVTLVGLDAKRAAVVPLNRFADLASYPKIVAVIAYDEPTEKIKQYAPYTLVANGTLQPGGGAMP
jgi:hypothetical protein